MKKIFVAGGWNERAEVGAAIEMLRAAGWEITFDWPKEAESEPELKGPRHCELLGQKFKNALRRSDVFWYMLPKDKGENGHFEFGFYSGYFDRESKGITIVSGEAEPLKRIYPFAMGGKGAKFNDHADALSHLLMMQ